MQVATCVNIVQAHRIDVWMAVLPLCFFLFYSVPDHTNLKFNLYFDLNTTRFHDCILHSWASVPAIVPKATFELVASTVGLTKAMFCFVDEFQPRVRLTRWKKLARHIMIESSVTDKDRDRLCNLVHCRLVPWSDLCGQEGRRANARYIYGCGEKWGHSQMLPFWSLFSRYRGLSLSCRGQNAHCWLCLCSSSPLESLDVILQEVRRWRILERGYQGWAVWLGACLI